MRRTHRVPSRNAHESRCARRLSAHPFPSVHKGRLSRLGWVICMHTQFWGCKHPTPRLRSKPSPQRRATCRHAFCPTRGSCWHWPPGSDCCRVPGLTQAAGRQWAGYRTQTAARCVHRATHIGPPKAARHLTYSRLGSPSAPSYFATPARGTERGCDTACSTLTQCPTNSAAVRFRPGNFKSFNSLSRVLFIFRSRYLFAIGLGRAILQLRKPWLAILSAVFRLHS